MGLWEIFVSSQQRGHPWLKIHQVSDQGSINKIDFIFYKLYNENPEPVVLFYSEFLHNVAFASNWHLWHIFPDHRRSMLQNWLTFVPVWVGRWLPKRRSSVSQGYPNKSINMSHKHSDFLNPCNTQKNKHLNAHNLETSTFKQTFTLQTNLAENTTVCSNT